LGTRRHHAGSMTKRLTNLFGKGRDYLRNPAG
jgi:hypothetical protein